MRKGILKNFAKFKGKHLCQSLFNNVAGLQIKRRGIVLQFQFLSGAFNLKFCSSSISFYGKAIQKYVNCKMAFFCHVLRR